MIKQYSRKLFIFSLSLFICLSILEGVFSLIGISITEYREYNFKKLYLSSEKYSKKIIFLGDSVTYGGNVQTQNNYPSQFAEIQKNSSHSNYNLENLGVCETNSYQTLEQVNKLVKTKEFDVAILLTGAADRYNFIGMDDDIIEDQKYNLSYENNLDNKSYKKLHIYKMFRYIHNRFKISQITCFLLRCNKSRDIYHEYWLNPHVGLPEWEEQYSQYNLMKKSLEALDYKTAQDHLDNINKHFKSFQMDTVKSNKGVRNVDLVELLMMFADPIANYHINKENFPKVIEFLLDILKNHPEIFFEKEDEINLFPYRFLHAIDFQEKYTPKDIVEVLNLENVKKLSHKSSYRQFIQYFLNKEELLEKVLEQTRENISKINSVLKKNNKKLILLNYPTDVAYANLAIKEVAKKNNITLLDLNHHFATFLTRENYSTYIYDYTHPTEKGYNVIAHFVWDNLDKILTTK